VRETMRSRASGRRLKRWRTFPEPRWGGMHILALHKSLTSDSVLNIIMSQVFVSVVAVVQTGLF
jgi:hypothetical protein